MGFLYFNCYYLAYPQKQPSHSLGSPKVWLQFLSPYLPDLPEPNFPKPPERLELLNPPPPYLSVLPENSSNPPPDFLELEPPKPLDFP
ncbi:hypothetical protein MtrunA17_Chr3g0095041 [Medicago truncatula]|uniref:Uncharacterized protein n=1 Tax=Medicago truncatula TaxID=3880 RepID=A0A396IUY7_MEDTR|nr:hypothetical protein MtrunA17_Chr3g0095041 [Medicago truncatula]